MVAELEARGYIDDRALAQQWADSRAGGRHLGSLRLRAELKRKGVAPDLADTAIRRAFSGIGEEERALEAGQRRLPALRRGDARRAPVKLRDYLLRRGYSPEVVGHVVRRLLNAVSDE